MTIHSTTSSIRRCRRVRSKIRGTTIRPRLTVFRSHTQIYAQLIDDVKAKTLVSATSTEIKKASKSDQVKVSIATAVGELLAQKALKAKISQVVFDRGYYRYHGRVKALAEGARKGGLKF